MLEEQSPRDSIPPQQQTSLDRPRTDPPPNPLAAAPPRPPPVGPASPAGDRGYTLEGIHEWNGFRTVASERGWYVPKGSAPSERAKMTHLMLDGGVLAVPPEDEDLFLREYFHYARFEGVPLFLNELKTAPYFCMMAEFDLYVADLLEQRQVDCLVRVVQVVMTDFVDEADTSAMVSAAPAPQKGVDLVPRPNDKNRTCYKYGMHFVWRGVPVDQKTAKLLRWALIRGIEQYSSEAEYQDLMPVPVTSWEEVFDIAVFLRNGLRLLWSHKAKACPVCHGKALLKKRGKGSSSSSSSSSSFSSSFEDERHRGAAKREVKAEEELLCQACEGIGKVNAGRQYEFYGAYTPEGELDVERTVALRSDEFVLLRENSIRLVVQPSDRAHLTEEAALIPLLRQFEAEKTAQRVLLLAQHQQPPQTPDKAGVGVRQSPADAPKKACCPRTTGGNPELETYVGKNGRSYRRYPLRELERTDPRWAAVADFVSKQEGSPEVTRINCNFPTNSLYTVSTSCHFCPNKRAEHASSTNYFILRVFGAQRRCFSKKPTMYPSANGSTLGAACMDWRGATTDVPESLRAMLFSSAELAKYEAKRAHDEQVSQARLAKRRDKSAGAVDALDAVGSCLSLASLYGSPDASTSSVYFLPTTVDGSSMCEEDSKNRTRSAPSSASPRSSSSPMLTGAASARRVCGGGGVGGASTQLVPAGGSVPRRSNSAMQLCAEDDLPPGLVFERYQRNAVISVADSMQPPSEKRRKKK